MAATVTVASKLPHGLRLQLNREAEATVDGKSVKKFIKHGPEVVIKGAAIHVGAPTDKHIAGGFALTHGVDAAFFAEWLRQHAEFPAVKEGLIFAHEKPAAAEGEAKSYAGLQSGFEPLDPSNPPEEFQAKVEAA